MTRFFIDTEFIEKGSMHPLYLISIGIVSERGDTYYAESKEFSSNQASQWVRENVFPHLTWKDAKSNTQICQEIYRFVMASCDVPAKPEFWGYYADYDWVAFCQLFGDMTKLPPGWPMYCRDIKQWCDDLGNPKLPEQGKGEHHALADAQWNKVAWEFLNNLRKD